jgi:integrase
MPTLRATPAAETPPRRADPASPDDDRLPAPAVSASGQAALDAAKDYARQALAPATRRAYEADWTHFAAWCATAGWPALPAPPAGVAAYLAAHAQTHGRATLRRRLAAIGQTHRLHGHDGLAGLRDRAMLLLGYAAALRRAELVAVAREHLVLEGSGLRLLVPRGKGDPEGEGAWIGVPRGERRDTCPVRAVEAWLKAADCRYGPVFRKVDCWGRLGPRPLHPDAVRQILLRRAKLAGLAVPALERLSPHGLRAGFVTEASKAGARDEQIMEHTRHRDLKTMRGYVRRAKLGTESPARLLGL